jgi:hypothetical protein
MIEIGRMGNSGRAVFQSILPEVEAATGDSADLARCITEADTDSGYWWRYQPAPHYQNEALIAMIHIAKVVADAKAHCTGKTYLVGSSPQSKSELYVFAHDHPDAHKLAINIMYDRPPAGKPICRTAIRQ